MRLRLLAVGTRMPDWVSAGFAEYAKRIAGPLRFSLQEIEPARRGASAPAARAMAEEGERLLAATQSGEFVVALDERGREWSTARVMDWLAQRMQQGQTSRARRRGGRSQPRATLQRAGSSLVVVATDVAAPDGPVLVAEQLYRRAQPAPNHTPIAPDGCPATVGSVPGFGFAASVGSAGADRRAALDRRCAHRRERAPGETPGQYVERPAIGKAAVIRG
ncbi:MAG: 23S rRNA (pseudouridine(1915)-N(3))-methyltransferase RlmH [Steroidobacteraceae bacterium]